MPMLTALLQACKGMGLTHKSLLKDLLPLCSNIWSRALNWDGTACTQCAAMVQATNGADPSRRLAMLGFCRSVSDLSEVVEDAVLSCGGKIVLNQIELKRCRHLTALHCL